MQKGLIHHLPVLRMDDAQEALMRRFKLGRILFRNTINFRRPENVHARQIGLPTTHLGEGLDLNKTCLLRLLLGSQRTDLPFTPFEGLGDSFA